MENKIVKIGILGLGNVGASVVRILVENSEMLYRRTGYRIEVKTAVVRSLEKTRSIDVDGGLVSTDPSDVLEDPEISIVVEAMGGEIPAYEYICRALNSKKYVVTANKEVVAKYKREFIELAKKNNVDIYFEAAVGGGIPIIRSLKVGYSANKIQRMVGILNGTTNYVLTHVEEDEQEFGEVVKKAQKLGFAEADPTMDLNGMDVAYKINILAAVAFKVDVEMEHILVEGIESITLVDINYAKSLGYKIKLLAIGQRFPDDRLLFKVHPTMIEFSHALASVREEFNAVYLTGDMVGEAMLYGKGAGGLPTGSAIVSDIVGILCQDLRPSKHNLEEDIYPAKRMLIEDTVSRFYLRLTVENSPGVLAKLTEILSKNKINLQQIHQKPISDLQAEIVILTDLTSEKSMKEARSQMKKVSELNCILRVGLDCYSN